MLMIIEERNGTETLLFEKNADVIYDMVRFFRNKLLLTVYLVDEHVDEFNETNFDNEGNRQRAENYHKEFYKFGVEPLKAVT